MDRSRVILALALALSLVSVFLGILQVVVTGKNQGFQSQNESFFDSGKAGIAKITVYGAIMDGEQGSGGVDASTLIKQLEEARDSNSIRAIMLVINSPGGSVGAVKKVYDTILSVKREKPVVAVVVDMAASGGYYLASACDRIFAYEGSILGSIGVISYLPDYSGIMQKYGVRFETVKSGDYKDFSSPFRGLRPEERQMYQQVLDDAYMQFMKDVAEGRGQALSTVRQWADGRVFSGKQAKAEQIIDDIGGEPEAIEAVKLILKTTRDLPVFEKEVEWWEVFSRSMGRGSELPFFGIKSNVACTHLTMPAGVLYMLPGAGFCIPTPGTGGL